MAMRRGRVQQETGSALTAGARRRYFPLAGPRRLGWCCQPV